MNTTSNVKWRRSKVLQYDARWFAVSLNLPHPSPPAFDHLFSCGLTEGTRHYAFETEAQLRVFLGLNPRSEECKDPLGLIPT